MKIIANTSKPGSYSRVFLVEATADELAKITGQSYASAMDKVPEIGDTIHVEAMYNHLRKLQASEKEMANTAKLLRAAATLCESLPAPFTPAKVEPEPEAK